MEYIVSTWGFDPPDFRTHLNYVCCIEALSHSLELNCKQSITKKFPENANLRNKLTLIRLTKNSLKGELETIEKNNDYAELCVSWISVKSYYLIFNLILVLNFLLDPKDSNLKLTHKNARDWLKSRLKEEDLVFNKKIFNLIISSSRIIKFQIPVGHNLKHEDAVSTTRVKQIYRKIVDYQLEQLKFDEKIKDFRKLKDRALRDECIAKEEVNLCEFFYWYRIKANYRDLEFLNHDIPTNSFYEYYIKYYNLTMNFYNAFVTQINKLSLIRFGHEIINP